MKVFISWNNFLASFLLWYFVIHPCLFLSSNWDICFYSHLLICFLACSCVLLEPFRSISNTIKYYIFYILYVKVINLFVAVTERCVTLRYAKFLSTNIYSRTKLHIIVIHKKRNINLRTKFLSFNKDDKFRICCCNL